MGEYLTPLGLGALHEAQDLAATLKNQIDFAFRRIVK
jgi:hypothetical protein